MAQNNKLWHDLGQQTSDEFIIILTPAFQACGLTSNILDVSFISQCLGPTGNGACTCISEEWCHIFIPLLSMTQGCVMTLNQGHVAAVKVIMQARGIHVVQMYDQAVT